MPYYALGSFSCAFANLNLLSALWPDWIFRVSRVHMHLFGGFLSESSASRVMKFTDHNLQNYMHFWNRWDRILLLTIRPGKYRVKKSLVKDFYGCMARIQCGSIIAILSCLLTNFETSWLNKRKRESTYRPAFYLLCRSVHFYWASEWCGKQVRKSFKVKKWKQNGASGGIFCLLWCPLRYLTCEHIYTRNVSHHSTISTIICMKLSWWANWRDNICIQPKFCLKLTKDNLKWQQTRDSLYSWQI